MIEKENEKQLETTWKWFAFHADQRLRAFYYFLIIIGALSYGFIQCIQGCREIQIISLFISFLGVLVSYAFLHLEIRNVELVNIGRIALRDKNFIPALIDNIKKPEQNFAKHKFSALNDTLKHCWWLFFIRESFVRHEFWLRLIYLTTFFVSIIALIYALYMVLSLEFIYWIAVLMLVIFLLFLFIYAFRSPWKRDDFLKGYLKYSQK